MSLSRSHGSLDESTIFIGHKMSQLDELVRIGPLVIVPGDEFDKFGAQLDTSLSIEARGGWVRDKVLRDYWGVNKFNDTLHVTSFSILDCLANLIPSGFLFETDSQVND